MPRNDDMLPSHPNRDRDLPRARVNEREITNNLDSIENGEDFSKVSAGYVNNGGGINHVVRDGVPVSTEDLFLAGVDTIGVNDLTWNPRNNLIPNGFSESGTAAVGKHPEGDGLVQTTHAREGGWCRSVTLGVVPDGTPMFQGLNLTGGFNSLAPAGTIKCQEGDAFKAEIWVKTGVATDPTTLVNLLFLWEKSDGTYDGATASAPTIHPTTTYQKMRVEGRCPAGYWGAQVYVECYHSKAADNGKEIFIDTCAAIQVTKFDELEADAIRTSDYLEEDGFQGSGLPVGTPIRGAKMQNKDLGNSLKVAADQLQLGRYVFKNLAFRLLNALDGDTTSGLTIYRGNTDYAVRNGTPWHGTGCQIALAGWSSELTATTLCTYNLTLPAGVTGQTLNYDALRFAEVQVYTASSTGTGAAFRQTFYCPLSDHGYSTDVNTSNAILASFSVHLGLVASPYSNIGSATNKIWLRVRIAGVYGASGSMWYAPTTNGVMLPQSSGPTGAPAPQPQQGTNTPVGGACPDPDEPVRVWRPGGAAGLIIDTTFGNVLVGDKLETLNETTGLPEQGEVSFHEVVADQPKQYTVLASSVWGQDPVTVTSSVGHRLLKKTSGHFGSVNWLWTSVDSLSPGDEVWGESGPMRVLQTLPAPAGPVVKIIVDGPHTFFSRGVLQHNAKAP